MKRILVGMAAALAVLSPLVGATAATETVIHIFRGTPDGDQPEGGLIMDTNGALYGTTSYNEVKGASTVFRLTPPAAGHTAWTETVLHAFKSVAGGESPTAGLIMDGSGALYGTTAFGGSHGAGTVFRLTPPAAGQTF